MSFDYSNVSDLFEYTVETIILEYIDDDERNEIIQYCNDNGIKTESQFENECYNGGLVDWIDKFRDYVYETIDSSLIYDSDAIDAINDIGITDDWNNIFREYGTPNSLAQLAAILQTYEFEEYGGYEALIAELYATIKDDLN